MLLCYPDYALWVLQVHFTNLNHHNFLLILFPLGHPVGWLHFTNWMKWKEYSFVNLMFQLIQIWWSYDREQFLVILPSPSKCNLQLILPTQPQTHVLLFHGSKCPARRTFTKRTNQSSVKKKSFFFFWNIDQLKKKKDQNLDFDMFDRQGWFFFF